MSIVRVMRIYVAHPNYVILSGVNGLDCASIHVVERPRVCTSIRRTRRGIPTTDFTAHVSLSKLLSTPALIPCSTRSFDSAERFCFARYERIITPSLVSTTAVQTIRWRWPRLHKCRIQTLTWSSEAIPSPVCSGSQVSLRLAGCGLSRESSRVRPVPSCPHT